MIKQIIDRTVSNEILEKAHFECVAEKLKKTEHQSKEEQLKDALINRLDGSMNFTNTHSVISQLVKIKSWSNAQKEKLLKIALNNYQVTYILKDEDVRRFYEPLCKNDGSENAVKVREKLNL